MRITIFPCVSGCGIEKITDAKLTLSKLIWAIRQADEMSQVDFADKLNITKQHLCDIEHARKSISPKLAAKYAEILGYSKEQFIRLALQDLVDRDWLNVQNSGLITSLRSISRSGILI